MEVSTEKKKEWQEKSSALTAELHAWYKNEIEMEKQVVPSDGNHSGSNIWNVSGPAIDSLRMCAILLYVEKHLNFQMPIEKCIKEGGHANLNEALEQLMPELEKAFYFGPPEKVEKKKKEKVSEQ